MHILVQLHLNLLYKIGNELRRQQIYCCWHLLAFGEYTWFMLSPPLCSNLCLTHADTKLCICMGNPDKDAYLILTPSSVQAQANNKKKSVSAHSDMNQSPERLRENLIAGPERRRQREGSREIKELWPSTLFPLAYLLHQPGSAKEIQFIIIDHTRLTQTLKKLHTHTHTQQNTHQKRYPKQMSVASVTDQIEIFQLLPRTAFIFH